MVRPMLGTLDCCFRASLLMALAVNSFSSETAWADPAPAFPSEADAWINSSPLSMKGLKGKGIVLWFFEEDDADIRERWEGAVEVSKKYDGKPIVFIAVNSGNPKARVQAYAQQLKLPWKILVDSSREFERACGVLQPVSPQNPSQVRYVTPDGEIQAEEGDDLDIAADAAGTGAEWKVDPESIPAALKNTWLAVEMGNYKGQASSLKKSTSSSKPELKEAATKMMEVVQKEIDDQVARIKESQENSNSFASYELLADLNERYNGFELPKETVAWKKELSKDPKVKAGTVATRTLELARKQLASGNPGLKTKATTALEKIVTDFPDTSLARQAKGLIDSSSE